MRDGLQRKRLASTNVRDPFGLLQQKRKEGRGFGVDGQFRAAPHKPSLKIVHKKKIKGVVKKIVAFIHGKAERETEIESDFPF